MSSPGTLERDLASVLDWLVTTEGLPTEVEAAARRLLLDTLGCAIAAGNKQEVSELGGQLSHVEPGPIDLPGLANGLSVSGAAHLLALAACWDEACEGLARAHGRPGLHTIPAVVALASTPDLGDGHRGRPATLGDVLKAVVAGYEVAGRLGEVLRIRPGMHVDGTWGSFGGGVGAGVMLGFDASTLLEVIEAVACQLPWSQYLPVAAGATARNLYVAEASARAIRVALATGAGVTAPVGAVTGYARGALSLDGDDLRLAPPGEWLIQQGYLKPYAAVRHVHYGVACALALAAERSAAFRVADVDSIELEVYPEAITYCGNRAPRTGIQAQFSLTYGLAHALVHGTLDPSAYGVDALADPDVTRLEALAVVKPLPDDGTRRARLTVGFNGTTTTVERHAVLGDPDNPFGASDVTSKFERYAQPVIGRTHCEQLVDFTLNGDADTPWSLSRVLKNARSAPC